MHKLDWQPAEEWVPYSHAPIFTTETTSAQTLRLVAGVPGGDARFDLWVHSPNSQGTVVYVLLAAFSASVGG
jgi:hypothetical protein